MCSGSSRSVAPRTGAARTSPRAPSSRPRRRRPPDGDPAHNPGQVGQRGKPPPAGDPAHARPRQDRPYQRARGRAQRAWVDPLRATPGGGARCLTSASGCIPSSPSRALGRIRSASVAAKAPATGRRPGADRRAPGRDPCTATASRRPRARRSRPRAGPANCSRPDAVLRTFLNAFRVADIRKKLAFTAAMLALYRIGAYIPVPGVNIDAVEDIANNFTGSNVLGFLNLFSGGSLQRFAIFALGIMPYITASIMLQLLTVVVPALDKLRKEGEVGQQKITQYTRYLTVALAFGQSIGYVFLFRTFSSGGVEVVDAFTFGRVFVIVMTLTAGCVLLMWFGELITQRGIGNGISLMIFASIVSGLPNGIQAWWKNPDQVFKVMMPFVALGVIAAIVFIQEGQRRIPIQYAKRVIGRRMSSGGQTYLPLRVNMAGVIPVIFAASIMAMPPTIGELAPGLKGLATFFSPNGWAYIVGETFFIIIFTYFYTAVTFNPVDQADNLKKYGGFIPGVRPGRPTAEFLDRILARLTFPGALFLGAVAALPTILINQTSANFFFGGTSIQIVIGVALDTMKQLEAQLMMRNYEGFLK